ncbi:protein of unknown function (plasmid) [Caballeronia sp. S22]
MLSISRGVKAVTSVPGRLVYMPNFQRQAKKGVTVIQNLGAAGRRGGGEADGLPNSSTLCRGHAAACRQNIGTH